jgi:hypothetical protein
VSALPTESHPRAPPRCTMHSFALPRPKPTLWLRRGALSFSPTETYPLAPPRCTMYISCFDTPPPWSSPDRITSSGSAEVHVHNVPCRVHPTESYPWLRRGAQRTFRVSTRPPNLADRGEPPRCSPDRIIPSGSAKVHHVPAEAQLQLLWDFPTFLSFPAAPLLALLRYLWAYTCSLSSVVWPLWLKF